MFQCANHRRFHPKDIPSLHSLFDSSEIRGLSDGTAVDTWSDISGNSRDVTGTTTTRPLFKGAIINGFPVVRFDGTDDHLKRTSASDMPTGDTTLVTVEYLNKAASSMSFAEQRYLVMWGTRATNQMFSGFYYKTSNCTYTFSQYGSGLSILNEPTQAWQISMTDKTGSGTSQATNVWHYTNGAVTSNNGNLNVQVVNLTVYFGQDGASTSYWLGDMMAVAVYSRVLTASERKMLVNYWGPRVSITAL